MLMYLADPLTIGLGVASIAASAFGGIAASKAGGKTPAAPVSAQPATPAAQPATPPSPTQTSGPSFLAAASAPPQVNQPGKTLLGQ